MEQPVELMNGIEVIRVLDNADFEVNRFDVKSKNLRVKEMKHHKAMAFYDCLKFINEAVFTVLVIGISAYLAGEGVISCRNSFNFLFMLCATYYSVT